MKKLDILIIRAFVGPFIATFFITMMVLVMQFFWLYIDDFVGKGLSAGLILEFIWYQSATLVPLALPLAVLLSSLMTFGNLGETYELVAIKSAGISLLRFMRPLFFVSVIISYISFIFHNNIFPIANLKSRTMLQDIVYAKPSFDLKEGVFYDKLSGFSIKIGKKEKNDSVIHDIVIFEQANELQDNFIVAKDGVMRSSPDKLYLDFVLRNGWRYQERGDRLGNSEYIRLGFKEYKKQFDLSSFQLQRTNDTVNKNNQRMLTMRQLDKAIDSMQREEKGIGKKIRAEVLGAAQFATYIDSNTKNRTASVSAKSINQLVPDSLKYIINQRVQNRISSIRMNNEAATSLYKEQQKNLRLHLIEWHRKLAYSVACLVMFLIGAPLGSIIRKGGLGAPMIFSIVFFLLFYFSSTTGEKFVKEGSWSPILGMWLSTIILTPIGLFLTYKAMHDSQLFNKEAYYRIGRRIKAFIKRKDSV
ncbi:MAG: YjgP/YjgQ family permease [Chitinophagaceae bacterium]